MPAQITHILAGEEALALPGMDLVRRMVALAPVHFRLGCQGPDIFYHNQRTRPSGLHFGALLHKRNYGCMLAAAAKAAAGEKGPARARALSFFLGVSTHAATDRTLHPFIIHFSGRTEHNKPETERFAGCHAFMERLIDMALLSRYRGLGPESFGIASSMDISKNPQTSCSDTLPEASPDRLSETETDCEIISRLWETGLRAAFPKSTSDDLFVRLRILNALDDARRFFALTDPANAQNCRVQFARFAALSGRERMRMAALLYPAYPSGIPAGLDFMNTKGKTWLHPSGDGRSSNTDCYSLFHDAVVQSAHCMLAFSGFMTGEVDSDGLEKATGNGCLGSCGIDGSPSPGNELDPLPLEAVLRLHSESILPA